MGESPQPTVETRKVGELITNPLQAAYFGRRSPEGLMELADIIRRNNNYIEPIDITPGNVILSGHQRRLVAINELHLDEVPVRVRHDLAAVGAEAEEQFFLDANIAGRQLTKLELVRAFLRGIELEKSRRRQNGRHQDGNQGRVGDVIAARFGKSRKALEDVIPILSTPRQVQRAFEQRELSGKEAKRIAAASAEQQAQIAEYLENGTPARKAMFQVLGANTLPPATTTQVKRWWRELFCRASDLLRAYPDCIDHILPSQKRGLQHLLDLADKVREMSLREPASAAADESDVDTTLPSQDEAPQKPKLLPKPKPALKPKPVLRPKPLPTANDALSSAS